MGGGGGLGLAPFGLDLQHLHFQAHFAEGRWDATQDLADAFPVRVTRQAEALLSAMALFVDVARGSAAVGERRTWLEPFWDDVFVAYIARGILAEHALWQGDDERALAEAEAAIDADAWPAHSPSVIRVTAIAPAARADRACAATGDRGCPPARPPRKRPPGPRCSASPGEGSDPPARPKAVLGPEGRGWLARCEAEYARLTGANSPMPGRAVLTEFGPGYVYETARTQQRLAEALAEDGRRDEAAVVLARGPRYRVPAAGRRPLARTSTTWRAASELPAPPGTGTGPGTAADQAAPARSLP